MLILTDATVQRPPKLSHDRFVATMCSQAHGRGAAVRSKIIRIGNSHGVRVPKSLIEQCHLIGDVELVPTADGLLVRPIAHPRTGWSDAFRSMREHDDDRLLDRDVDSGMEWDEHEWEW